MTTMRFRHLFLILALLPVLVAGCGKTEEAPPPAAPSGVVPGPSLTATEQRYKDLLRTDPNNTSALIGLGNLYYDTQRWAEAIEQYEKVLAVDPSNVDVMVDMGTVYRNMGQPDRAIDLFRKASGINPNHENALFNRGVVLAFDKNDKKGAIEAWQELLQRHPGFPKAADLQNYIAQFQAEIGAAAPPQAPKATR